jgi:hypothetical protein
MNPCLHGQQILHGKVCHRMTEASSPLLPQHLLQYLVEGVDRPRQAEVEAVRRHPLLHAVGERVSVHVRSGVPVRPHDGQVRDVQHVDGHGAAALPRRGLRLLVHDGPQLLLHGPHLLLPLPVRLLPRARRGEGVALEVRPREGGQHHVPLPDGAGAHQPLEGLLVRQPHRHGVAEDRGVAELRMFVRADHLGAVVVDFPCPISQTNSLSNSRWTTTTFQIGTRIKQLDRSSTTHSVIYSRKRCIGYSILQSRI